MADVVDKATRSRMMSGIKAKNTRPEIFVRKGLHALGYRFRLHVKNIPGKPDMVFPKYQALIIVNGCFWHGHRCHYCKTPSTNTAFWLTKIQSNVVRDEQSIRRQMDAGWRCLVIWECAVRASSKKCAQANVVDLAAEWLKSDSKTATICIKENNSIQIVPLDSSEEEYVPELPDPI